MTVDKHHWYDGLVYEYVVDPALRPVREGISREIDEGSTVVDLACGTGSLSFMLAQRCRAVLGVELSQDMVTHAQSKITPDTDHVKIIHGDASQLSHIKDGEFDYATISMALHEMPQSVRLAVVTEARRIAKTTVFADFNAPIPRTIMGLRSCVAEFLAGMDHFNASRDFQARGGLPALIKEAGGTIDKSKLVRSRTVQIVVAH